MPRDYTTLLWLLKLGAIVNLAFLANTFALPSREVDLHIVVPSQILFAVSAYRCLFPNRYKDNVVFHASVLSSTLVTRTLATCAEVAWIYQLAHVLRAINAEAVGWVDIVSWLMVAQVVVSQVFVWGAISTGRLSLYYNEEVGWFAIIVANTVVSGFLYSTVETLGARGTLLELNLLFGLVYLPWQVIHLRALRADASGQETPAAAITPQLLLQHLARALHERRRATDSTSWGGPVGLTWMTAYWATLIPMWVNQIVAAAAIR